MNEAANESARSPVNASRWVLVGRIVTWVLALGIASVMLPMGWEKFDPNGFWSPAFERWGYPAWFRVFTGILEVAGGLAILWPRIARYGAAVLVVVMLGASARRALDGNFVDVAFNLTYVAVLVLIAWVFRPKRTAAWAR